MSETVPNVTSGSQPPARAGETLVLSAPELCVLRDEGRADGREVLRMAVLELIARGVLRLDTGDASRRHLSVQRTDLDVGLDAPLAAVAASLGSAPMTLRSLDHELSLTWTTPKEYLWAEVVPALVARDLVQVVDRPRGLRWLGSRLELTPLGRDARAALDERLAVLSEDFGKWVRDDPERALGYIEQAGAAVLLERSAWPQARELGGRARGAAATAAIAGHAVPAAALGAALDLSILDSRAAAVVDGGLGGLGGVTGSGAWGAGEGGGGCGDGGGGGC